ncbi:hypothetical protein V2J09_019083 [Rumex salicifolius]
MAGGMIANEGGINNRDFPAKLTFQVFICCIIAAFGGLMFGYDIGISGGVTSMDDFLEKFFPSVYVRKHEAKENNYCKYNNQYLQLFTSSLYLSAIVCCYAASYVCKSYGRKRTMMIASLLFLAGAGLSTAAMNMFMLILGRVLLGAGVGFGNQAVPLFISEIAPPKFRGALNVMFQLLITIGILIANIVNYYTSRIYKHGWRVSLGGAAIPAIFLFLGSLVISETPTSLVERGRLEEGLQSLKRVRGTSDVEKEFALIMEAVDAGKKVKHPFRNLMKRSSRPQLVCGTILQVFQQFTGINVIMFYAPVLFQTMGMGGKDSLFQSVATSAFNSLATLVAVFSVDYFGRKALLIEAAVQMFVTQTIVGVQFYRYLHVTGSMPQGIAKTVVWVIIGFVMGFAWSWGPLGWLIPSEIYPIETRPAGFFFAVSTNMVCTFIIAQAFLTMLCRMRWGIFFFFSAWILVMGLFALFFIPETKGIPIDEMVERRWKKHWYWKKYFDEDEVDKVEYEPEKNVIVVDKKVEEEVGEIKEEFKNE